HVDILCSDPECSRFVHIQVKTFAPNARGGTCQVGLKAETDYGGNFFWVLCGLPRAHTERPQFYVIPSAVMARHVRLSHKKWLVTPGRNGRPHNPENSMRIVSIPPRVDEYSWDISPYADAWQLIVK